MRMLLVSISVALVLSACRAEPVPLFEVDEAPSGVKGREIPPVRVRRDAGDTERDCTQNPPYHPNTAVDTTAQVAKLREYMLDENYDAYIVPSQDAHGSEYIASPDKRRQYISGFSGSAGVAIITKDDAALWTDGRYFIQGERQLWCIWQLMKSGQDGVPRTSEWLVNQGDMTQAANLPENGRIGYDPRLMSISTVNSYNSAITDSGRNLTMAASVDNIVDWTWNALDGPKPVYQDQGLIVLTDQYTGKSWEDKIRDIREQLTNAGADHVIVTKLDEIAWVFNLRGRDIPYNPMFISYAIISTGAVRLYAYDKARRIDADQAVVDHLKINNCGGNCITVKDYGEFVADLEALPMEGELIWFSDISNYFIYETIPEANRYIEASPILLTKSQKNDVEIAGMKEAHRLDSIAICETAAWVDETIKGLADPSVGDKSVLSELIVEDKALEYRQKDPTFQGLSFRSISSFGANGAVIHYSSAPETDVPITNQGIFLFDSGGQYLTGTCDITRSFHFGDPTNLMKEAYTRVLMGHADLLLTKFRTNVYGRDLDAMARAPLWDNGLDYRHGTGHGIGHFLNVHEGPARISIGYNSREKPIHAGMFFSDEPGYYEDGEFGLRIEDIMYAKIAETGHKFNDPTYQYMGFEIISFVPLEPNLIDFSIMSEKQIEWYNSYNADIREKISPHLSERAKKWVNSKTEKYNAAPPTIVTSFTVVIISSIVAVFMQ